MINEQINTQVAGKGLIDGALQTIRRMKAATSGLGVFAVAFGFLIADEAYAGRASSYRSNMRRRSWVEARGNTNSRMPIHRSYGIDGMRFGDERDFQLLPERDDY